MTNDSSWIGCTAVALLVVAVTTEAQACESDTDCKGDRVCQEGNCVAPNEAGAQVGGNHLAPSVGQNTPAPQAEIDDRAQVERALGRDVEGYHVEWQIYGKNRIPQFSNYVYLRLERERKKGIILAAAVGGGIFALGSALTITLEVIGMYQANSCSDETVLEPGDECVNEGLGATIAGWVVAGTLLATSVTFVIVGTRKAKRAKTEKLALEGVRAGQTASSRLGFVGVAPLFDSRNSPGGLAFLWQF